MFYADNFCKYTETIEGGKHYYVFTGPCIITKKMYTVKIPGPELYAYNHSGKHIQDAMPSVSADDRQFLMSGHSPEGWEIVFGKDEDDEVH